MIGLYAALIGLHEYFGSLFDVVHMGVLKDARTCG